MTRGRARSRGRVQHQRGHGRPPIFRRTKAEEEVKSVIPAREHVDSAAGTSRVGRESEVRNDELKEALNRIIERINAAEERADNLQRRLEEMERKELDVVKQEVHEGEGVFAHEMQGDCFVRFLKLKPESFKGSVNPEEAEQWIRHVEKCFEDLPVTDRQKVAFASFMLEGEASQWWEDILPRVSTRVEQPLTWSKFKDEFFAKYFPYTFRVQQERDFIHLRQGNLSVAEYDSKFTALSRFLPELVNTENRKCKRFLDGLHYDIRTKLSYMGIENYAVLVDKALQIENYFPNSFQAQQERAFIHLKQGNLSVAEYDSRFIALSRFLPELVNTEERKCKRFLDGLHYDIRTKLSYMGIENYAVLVDKALQIEKDLMELRGRSDWLKRSRFEGPRGGSNMGVHGERPLQRGRSLSQGTVVQSQRQARSITSVAQSNTGGTLRFGRQAMGIGSYSRRVSLPLGESGNLMSDREARVCFRCNQMGHLARNCPTYMFCMW